MYIVLYCILCITVMSLLCGGCITCLCVSGGGGGGGGGGLLHQSFTCTYTNDNKVN